MIFVLSFIKYECATTQRIRHLCIADLHDSQNYASRVDVEIVAPPPPRAVVPTSRRNPVTPAASNALGYRSESAESLCEIPVSETQTGRSALQQGPHLPPKPSDVVYSYDVRNGGFSRSTLPAAKKISSKRKKRLHSSNSIKKRPLPLLPGDSQNFQGDRTQNEESLTQSIMEAQTQPGDSDVVFHNSGGVLQRETTPSFTLGATDISMTNGHVTAAAPKRMDVPPLDLGELASVNSDTEVVIHSKTHGKKKKRKVITKV